MNRLTTRAILRAETANVLNTTNDGGGETSNGGNGTGTKGAKPKE